MSFILPQIKELSFDLRKVSDYASTVANCIRADIGEPNLAAPPQIKEILQELIAAEKFEYASTFGVYELINAISDYENEKMSAFQYPQICVTAGAQAALFSVLSAAVQKGDGLIVDSAFYPPYKSIASILQLNLLECDFADPDSILQAAKNGGKAIIVNNPCNPTGAVYAKDELEKIATAIQTAELMCISDDVYDRIYFGDKPESIAKFIPEQTVCINSISKSHSLTGMRIGWMFGSKELVRNAAKVHRNINSCPNTLAQRAVAKLLPNSEEYLANARATYKTRAEQIHQIFAEVGFHCTKPQGGLYVFPQIEKIDDSEEFAFALMKHSKVSSIPGKFFGSKNTDRIRFCFGALTKEQIAELGKRLTDYCKTK
jgi:aspartate/methionine/tyrosine aminotransferase